MITIEPKLIKTRGQIEYYDNGTIQYSQILFPSICEAIADAVVNHGENLDEMIACTFTSTNNELRPILNKMIAKLDARNNLTKILTKN